MADVTAIIEQAALQQQVNGLAPGRIGRYREINGMVAAADENR